MSSNPSTSRLILYFTIGALAAAAFCFKGYTSHLKVAKASEAKDTEVIECSNGSRIFSIKNGIIVGKDGDIISSGFELIPQTSMHSDLYLKSETDLNRHHLIRHPKLLFPRYVRGTVATIAAGGSSCYFHWMFDVLAKLDTLERSGLTYDKLYVSEPKHSFQKETLDLLADGNKKLVIGSYWTQIYAETILAPELPTKALKVPSFAIEMLKKRILPSEGPSTSNYLLISRKQAPSRRATNEDEALERLSKWDIEPVSIKDYTIREQAWISSQAKLIIAAHGSGLVNIIFTSPGTHVIELFPEDNHPPFYKDICSQIGVNYQFLDCKTDQQGNLIIPVDDLELLCAQILGEANKISH